MSRSVYKYRVELADSQTVYLPSGARVLDIQPQYGELQLWALVDPVNPVECPHELRIHGTGHTLDDTIDHFRHVSTFQLEGGGLVFHAFMRDGVGR